MARGTCRCCGNEYNINADGTVRYHLAADAECQESPDSRKCRGVGKRPAGAPELPETVTGYVCRVPAGPDGCGRPVQLHDSGRARSHLDNSGHPCGGGSDWPLKVLDDGTRRDTKPEPYPAVAPEELRMDDGPKTAGEFDPHGREADIAIAEVERVRREEDTAYETAVQDGLREVRRIQEARAVLAGDGRTPEQQAEIDRRMEDPVGSALVGLMGAETGSPGTVLDRLGFDPRDPEGPGEEPTDMSEPVRQGHLAGIFDPTHTVTDESGIDWTHPGEAADCRLPGCCAHPRGFEYMDDDNGPSGDFCPVCGAERPDPVPGPDDWKTPARLLADMPEGVRRLAEDNPECWDCGHEVTPLAERFGPDSRVTHVVWACSAAGTVGYACPDHRDRECRPQHPTECRVDDLSVGVLFRRHTKPGPLGRLVYRAQSVSTAGVEAIVATEGPYAGKTGTLTNLEEEITCTDLNGNARVRRDRLPDPGTGAISHPGLTPGSRPGDPGSAGTPSRPAPTTSSAPPARTNSPIGTPTVSGPGSTRPTRASARGAGPASTPETGSGPTAKTGTSARTAGRTVVPDAFSTPKQAVNESDKYDRYGRYKLTHPDSGKAVKWTRATTFAKSIQDTFALSQWAQRMTLKGAAIRRDLVDAAGTLDVKIDKDRMNGLVDEAKKAAGDKVAANKGTAVHAYTEDRDKVLAGEEVRPREIPEEHLPTVEAYEAVLKDFGLEPVPGLIEFTTAVKQYEVAGTSDRVYRVTKTLTFKLNGRSVTLYAGEYVIGDVKTGADLSYGWQEIAIQLALYAQGLNTSGVWSWEHGTWAKPVTVEDPAVLLKVRTDVGLVPHLPVDRERTGAPLATLYAVDLDAGWAATVLCGKVRSWRKERTLSTPLTVADMVDDRAVPVRVLPDPEPASKPSARPVTASRPATLEEKAKAVTSRAEASAVFKEATAARVTRAQLDELVSIMKTKLESFVEQGA